MPETTSDTPRRTVTDKLKAAVPTWLHVSDIQGLAQLATQATLGVTGLAETVQGTVYKSVAARFGTLGKKFVDDTPGNSGVKPVGITGFVYGSIRGVTRLAGGTVNAVLAKAAPLAGKKGSTPPREAMLAAINGVLGDQLVATANPLAIPMQLRRHGEALALETPALTASVPDAGKRVMLMVHGLCMNDLQWADASGDCPADKLARDLGYTPLWLHYNTGLHISDNGQQLSALLAQLVDAWPGPLEDITLITHSMGGLVARSAAAHAESVKAPWRRLLKSIVFLGTPHHGAPFELAGSWVDTVLGSNTVTKPFAQIGQIRSAGITDLRYGNVTEADWGGTGRVESLPDTREPVPLPQGVACYAIAATTTREAADGGIGIKTQLANHYFGDGLVPLHSALGVHADGSRSLGFAESHQWTAWQTNHMALLTAPAVFAKIRDWLAGKTKPAGAQANPG